MRKLFALVFCLVPLSAFAQTVNDVGTTPAASVGVVTPKGEASINGTDSLTGAEPTMSPRFFRSGVPGSACSTFSAGNFQYKTVDFTTDASGSLSATFSPGTCGTGIYVTFHTAPFNPASICTGHVWAFGSSTAFSETFPVAPNTAMQMVVSGVATAPGVVCGPYTYDVSGVGGGTSADLSIDKTQSTDTPRMTGDLTYTLTVTNLGPADATNVSVSDPLPAYTTFLSATAPAGWTLTTPAVGAGGTVTATRATLAPGAGAQVITVTVYVSASAPGGTVITNTATVASDTTDPAAPNNASSKSATVTAPVPTMSEWALLLLGLTLAAIGILTLRRRAHGGTAA